MKENIKIHVNELFLRNEINNKILEKELISILEEKYDNYFFKTNNEIIAFNKTISLIGDIDEIKKQNKVLLKEEKKEISIEQRKKINKFSKINIIISIIIYLLISIIFRNWITSWLIFALSFIVESIYKLFCYREIYNKVLRYITTIMYSLFAIIIVLVISISAFFVDYDYSFELIEENIKKEVTIDNEYQTLNVSLLNSDIIFEAYEGNEFKVIQYSKNDLPSKYYFDINTIDNEINIKEDTAPLFFMNNYYHSIYKVLIPINSNLIDIDIFGISSDIKFIGNFTISNLTVETTSGNIDLGSNIVLKGKTDLKVLRGYLNIENVIAEDLFNISSSSGKITMNNVDAMTLNISSIAGNIELKNIKSSTLSLNSTAGNINGENIKGLIDIHDKKGEIQLYNIELTAKSNIETETGNIYLTFNEYGIYNLNVSSENGKIENVYLNNIDGIILDIFSKNGNISILLDK